MYIYIPKQCISHTRVSINVSTLTNNVVAYLFQGLYHVLPVLGKDTLNFYIQIHHSL